jgi:very-short-patch-repair endonuclease
MGNYIRKDNIPVLVFKRENPDLYKKIMNEYSPVFDATTAVELYINNIPPPTCEICGVRLLVTKKKPSRCQKHINIKSVYKYIDIPKKQGLEVKYFAGVKNPSETIVVSCNLHGEYDQLLKSYISDHGCQKCYFLSKKGILHTSWDEYKERFLKTHGDKYDYSKSLYKGAVEKINITCKKHGEFEQNANVHAAGSGCPKCANEENSIRQSSEESVLRKRTHMAHRIKNNVQKKKDSKLELDFKKFLNTNNIYYEHQYIINDDLYTGSWTYDFYIPSLNLLVEMDGEYWHKKPETINRDIIKNKLAKKFNFLLLRISDSDIRYDIIFSSKEKIMEHTEKIMSARITNAKEKYGIIVG